LTADAEVQAVAAAKDGRRDGAAELGGAHLQRDLSGAILVGWEG